MITTVVGNRADRPAACATSHCGLNGPATAAWLIGPKALALAPDGSLLVADVGSNPGTHLIGRVNAALPGVTAWNIAVASDDGSEVYVFDQQGGTWRHGMRSLRPCGFSLAMTAQED